MQNHKQSLELVFFVFVHSPDFPNWQPLDPISSELYITNSTLTKFDILIISVPENFNAPYAHTLTEAKKLQIIQ